GQKDIDNGIILLVAPKEKKVRIEVGYGLEPIMTDALSNQIIQTDIIPRFKSGDMAGGIIAGAQAIADQMKAPPDEAERKVVAAANSNRQAAQDNGGIPWALIFWLIIIGFMIASRFGRGRYGRRHGGIWPVFLWGPGFGGGSSWGGGSGSSGGGWGGGGGGGFSGGGGSFGGGGASGSW
ncbi:MAG: TPM domain-containing protein, partial [Sphingomonas sp.]